MLRAPRYRLISSILGFFLAFSGGESVASAQPLGGGGKRVVSVGGIVGDARVEDVLGIARYQFQGLIAVELTSAGFAVEDATAPTKGASLALWGTLKEEACDGPPPGQCRIAVQWELQDSRGVVVYRTLTRAVTEGKGLDQERRELVLGSLRSLLQRRRFGLQLAELGVPGGESGESLGFKQCRRELQLPEGLRAAATALVLVVSGSNLQRGSVISADGLVLTSAEGLSEHAPLTVRFAAGQSVGAEIASLNRKANLALLRTLTRTDNGCIPVVEDAAAVGTAVYGVSSALSEDAATSLTQSLLVAARGKDPQWLQVDARIANAPGAPLLDDHGRLIGVVAGSPEPSRGEPGKVWALGAHHALVALQVRPAAVSDARLSGPSVAPPSGYVRDPDDAPYALDQRYTYGTAPVAKTLRTAGLIAGGVGAAAIGYTWLSYRASSHPTPAEHRRFVLENDAGWILFGLGAAAVGVSFVWPESHEVVAVGTERAESRRRWTVGVSAGGVTLGGSL